MSTPCCGQRWMLLLMLAWSVRMDRDWRLLPGLGRALDAAADVRRIRLPRWSRGFALLLRATIRRAAALQSIKACISHHHIINCTRGFFFTIPPAGILVAAVLMLPAVTRPTVRRARVRASRCTIRLVLILLIILRLPAPKSSWNGCAHILPRCAQTLIRSRVFVCQSR